MEFVKTNRWTWLLAAVLLSVSLVAGASGCSQQVTQTLSGLITPAGTYSIGLIFTGSDGLTTTHTVPARFTVLPAPTVFQRRG